MNGSDSASSTTSSLQQRLNARAAGALGVTFAAAPLAALKRAERFAGQAPSLSDELMNRIPDAEPDAAGSHPFPAHVSAGPSPERSSRAPAPAPPTTQRPPSQLADVSSPAPLAREPARPSATSRPGSPHRSDRPAASPPAAREATVRRSRRAGPPTVRRIDDGPTARAPSAAPAGNEAVLPPTSAVTTSGPVSSQSPDAPLAASPLPAARTSATAHTGSTLTRATRRAASPTVSRALVKDGEPSTPYTSVEPSARDLPPSPPRSAATDFIVSAARPSGPFVGRGTVLPPPLGNAVVHRSPSNLVARQPAAPLDAAASPAAAPSEAIAGAQPMAASASPSVDEAPSTDITQLADRVYDLLVGRLLIERERRGLWR